MGYSRKSPNRGGVEDTEFLGVLKKSMWKFQGSIKKELEFPGVFLKSSCGISTGLAF